MDKKQEMASVCGLFCASCTVYIGTQEDRERLAVIAKGFGCAPEDLVCHGCHSTTRARHCRECGFIACAEKRNVASCGACADYPCPDLREFQTKMPHRLELWESHDRIRQVGAAAWCKEMVERYSCPSCRTMNSAYDVACRKCGHTPGNDFVSAHNEAIVAHLSKRLR